MRIVFSYFAQLEIGASANFKMSIKFPSYPVRVARMLVSSSANVEIGGDLFTRLKVMDQSIGSGGEHKKQIDLDGSITLGGIAGDEMRFQTDIKVSGKNLVAATTKIQFQFTIIAGDD